jgi:hypothetical protein
LPRLSSPLYAKASVRSPSTLDRSQQNAFKCVSKGVYVLGHINTARQCRLPPHPRKVVGHEYQQRHVCQTMSSRITPKAYEQAGTTLHLQFHQGRRPWNRSTRGYPHNRPNCFIVSNNHPLNSYRGAWWSQTDSNRRHPACKAGALPTELWPHSRTKLKPWLAWTDSNCRPYAYQAYALTT